MEDFFNTEQREIQKKFEGDKVADILVDKRVHYVFTDYEQAFVERSCFFFIATAHDGQIDCSYKGGEPGFVRVTGPSQVTWPDYDGNLMFRTLGNIAGNPNVSMLFCNFEDASQVSGPGQVGKLRLNGRASIQSVVDENMYPGAKNLVVVDLDFILPNCPRYLPDMSVVSKSRFNPKKDYSPPNPEWKSRDYIVPLLPKD